MATACRKSCFTCRDAPSLQESCPRACGLCPPAAGAAAVRGFWIPVPGGLVLEARKQQQGAHWPRLTHATHPANRIAPAEGGVEVGALLNCSRACAAQPVDAAPECAVAERGVPPPAAELSAETGVAAESDAAAESALAMPACEQRCRTQCAAEFAARYAVR